MIVSFSDKHCELKHVVANNWFSLAKSQRNSLLTSQRQIARLDRKHKFARKWPWRWSMSTSKRGEPLTQESVDSSMKNVPFLGISLNDRRSKGQTPLKILRNLSQGTSQKSEKSFKTKENFVSSESKSFTKNFWKNTKECILNSTNCHQSTPNPRNNFTKCWETCLRR